MAVRGCPNLLFGQPQTPPNPKEPLSLLAKNAKGFVII
jgi:hypothetical protein